MGQVQRVNALGCMVGAIIIVLIVVNSLLVYLALNADTLTRGDIAAEIQAAQTALVNAPVNPDPLATLTTDELRERTARNIAVVNYLESEALLFDIQGLEVSAPPADAEPAVSSLDEDTLIYTLACRNDAQDLRVRSTPTIASRTNIVGEIPEGSRFSAVLDEDAWHYDTAGNPWTLVAYEDADDGFVTGWSQVQNQSSVFIIWASLTNCAQDFQAQFEKRSKSILQVAPSKYFIPAGQGSLY